MNYDVTIYFDNKTSMFIGDVYPENVTNLAEHFSKRIVLVFLKDSLPSVVVDMAKVVNFTAFPSQY